MSLGNRALPVAGGAISFSEETTMDSTIKTKERTRRRELAGKARKLISESLPVQDTDESSLMLDYGDFYLQVAFSELHPLVAIYLARAINRTGTLKDIRLINDLNQKSVLGSHTVNTEAGCYSYRAVHWLDTELTQPRFIEILERSADEAGRTYNQLMRGSEASA